ATRVASDEMGVKMISVRLWLASPHQSGFGSRTVVTSGTRRTILKGPVPLACRVAKFSTPALTLVGSVAPLASAHSAFMIYQVVISCGKMGLGPLVIKSTVWSSTILASFTEASLVATSEPCATARWNEKT